LEPHRHKIASAIAFLGGIEEFHFLRAFVWDRFQGPVNSEIYGALVAAHGGFGYLAANIESPEVVDYLIASSNPTFWHKLPWADLNSPSPPNGTASRLAELSVSSLGLCGRPDVRGVLKQLRSKGVTPSIRRIAERSIRVNEKVARVGIAAYLADYKTDSVEDNDRGLK
jgi:hypothetical protein